MAKTVAISREMIILRSRTNGHLFNRNKYGVYLHILSKIQRQNGSTYPKFHTQNKISMKSTDIVQMIEDIEEEKL